MKQLAAYRGREVVVLGLARSGVAAAKLFHGIRRRTSSSMTRKTAGTMPGSRRIDRLWAFLSFAAVIRTDW